MEQATITLIFSGAVTVSTVVYAVLTWKLVVETKRLRQGATDPAIIVYVSPSRRWINMFELVIHNYGAGPARNLKCTVGTDLATLKASKVVTDPIAMLSNLRALAPGQEVRAFIGSAIDILSGGDIPNVPVSVSYSTVTGETQRHDFELNFNQYRGLTTLGEPVDEEMAKALKDIATHLDRLVRGRLQVVVSDNGSEA